MYCYTVLLVILWKVFYKIQMPAAINAHIFHQATTKKKTLLLKYLMNLAEQLVLTGHKSAQVKHKTTALLDHAANKQRNSSMSETTCPLIAKEDDNVLDVCKQRLTNVQNMYKQLVRCRCAIPLLNSFIKFW